MEEIPYGHKLVFPISVIISVFLLFVLIQQKVYGDDLSFPFAIFFITLFNLPGFFRYLICYNWREINAEVLEKRNLSEPYFHWRGTSLNLCYEAKIQYCVNDQKIFSVIRSNKPFKEYMVIYYHPKDPLTFTQTRKLSKNSLFFTLIIVLALLSKR